MDEPTLRAAAERLGAGDLVAIPTETVYGLAADATNPAAVARVFALKGRPADHPLIVHCASAEQAWACAASVSEGARRLAEEFWPGPLTLVLPRAPWVADEVTGGQTTVALRVPAHPLARAVIAALGRPVVAPSANRFGRVSPTTAQHVRDEFPDGGLLVLDGGACDVGVESTIVDCRPGAGFAVLRPGGVTAAQLEAALGPLCRAGQGTGAPRVRVSGSLDAHYAPRAQVLTAESGELAAWVAAHAEERVRTLVVGYCDAVDPLPASMAWRGAPRDAAELARRLYGLLRSADDEGFDRVVFELPAGAGIEAAIRDRLARAAHPASARR